MELVILEMELSGKYLFVKVVNYSTSAVVLVNSSLKGKPSTDVPPPFVK